MGRFKYGFTDSDVASFNHERELRAERPPPPPDKAWQLLRSPSGARDQALTSLAQAWRDGLPARLQPHALCQRYPRIANRLALCWSDPALTEAVFRDLLNDRRGGRKGFPEEVRCELVVLQAVAREQGLGG